VRPLYPVRKLLEFVRYAQDLKPALGGAHTLDG
jgi:hypothetical protein